MPLATFPIHNILSHLQNQELGLITGDIVICRVHGVPISCKANYAWFRHQKLDSFILILLQVRPLC